MSHIGPGCSHATRRRMSHWRMTTGWELAYADGDYRHNYRPPSSTRGSPPTQQRWPHRSQGGSSSQTISVSFAHGGVCAWLMRVANGTAWNTTSSTRSDAERQGAAWLDGMILRANGCFHTSQGAGSKAARARVSDPTLHTQQLQTHRFTVSMCVTVIVYAILLAVVARIPHARDIE